MKIFYCCLLVILLIFSCKEIKNFSNPVWHFFDEKFRIINYWRQKPSEIGIEKNYAKTDEGSICLQIIRQFIKNNRLKKVKLINLSNDQIIQKLKDNSLAAVIGDFNTTGSRLILQSGERSIPFLKNAIYYLVSPENSAFYDLQKILINRPVGFLYESAADDMLIKTYGKRSNFFRYKDIDNLVENFRIHQVELMIISRWEYYSVLPVLSSKVLSVRDDGNAFSPVLFTDYNLKKKFDIFLSQYLTVGYDWSLYLNLDPEKDPRIKAYAKNLDQIFQKIVIFFKQ